MSNSEPILVTGAAGQVGGIGGRIVELLRAADTPVRALVRRDDERAGRLRRLGAEVVVADLTQPDQVVPALEGCRRAYFGMGVSPSYLEATLVVAAAARETSGFELLVNMSQMTVSQMDLRHMTESLQQRLHWLCEQALNDWRQLADPHRLTGGIEGSHRDRRVGRENDRRASGHPVEGEPEALAAGRR
jgi:NAD(P)H dehydrogenase (quinone)